MCPPKVEDELETEGLKGEFDRNQASKSLASTLNRLMDKLDGGGARGGDKEEEEGAGRKAEGRLRVRVSRIGRWDPPKRDPPPPENVESEVRELLAKEGLRAEGTGGILGCRGQNLGSLSPPVTPCVCPRPQGRSRSRS